MLYNLKCNNIKCFTPLRDALLYTTCGHIYCQPCSTKIYRTKKCLACNHTLHNPSDLIIRNIRHKSDLMLIPPENVIDEARRSLCFWMYQVYEELEIKKRQIERMSINFKMEIDELNIELNKVKLELELRGTQISDLKMEVEREKNNYFEIEERFRVNVKEMKRISAMNEKLKFDMRNNKISE